MATIQLTVEQLKSILDEVELLNKIDSSTSTTIEIGVIETADTHLGGDKIEAWLKSNYSECIGSKLYPHL